jgi:hypothetical protein
MVNPARTDKNDTTGKTALLARTDKMDKTGSTGKTALLARTDKMDKTALPARMERMERALMKFGSASGTKAAKKTSSPHLQEMQPLPHPYMEFSIRNPMEQPL